MKVIFAASVLLILSGLSYANPPDQPYMQAALTDLQQARADLQRAASNKGGHRTRAIGYVNRAIEEVNRGIAYDRHNNHSVKPAASVASPDQPNMTSALDNLKRAKKNLQLATADKGGHRGKAIDNVNRAIDEVNRGIAVGR
jgi:hypothetical protein